MPIPYDHIVRFDPILRRVTIIQLDGESRETLFTHLDLPENPQRGGVRLLWNSPGELEDILIDSPVARDAPNL